MQSLINLRAGIMVGSHAFGDDAGLPIMPLLQKWHDNPTLRALLGSLNRAHKKGFWPGAFHGVSLFVTINHSR